MGLSHFITPLVADLPKPTRRGRTRPLMTALLALVATVLTIWAVPTAAQAGTSYEQVVNRQTDQCLDVWFASTQHAANVGVWRCVGADNQLWDFQAVGNGYYYIKVRHTGMCLNVAYYGQIDGANVVQAVCSGGTNEQWRVAPLPGGYNLLIARHSGKCLDKASNGNVVQWTCHGQWWQQWKRADTAIPT